MDKRSHRLLFLVLLLPVYAVFFFVESFFNFEGQTNTRDILHYAALSHTHVSHPHAAGNFSTGGYPLPSSTHGLRLNKRYTPADIPPCPIVPPALPCYPLPPNTGVCPDPPCSDFSPLTYTLRGPPIAV